MTAPVVSRRSEVPWWAALSSLLAPVLLVGGWTLAARLQTHGFDSVSGTISDLAALDADARWVMTVGIAGTGVCHLVTAAGLRPAAVPGRRLLAAGGVATVLVAVFPLPAGGGSSSLHAASAVAGFVLLSVWVVPARRYGSGVPWGLRSAVAVRAAAVLGALTIVFFAAALLASPWVGLAERAAAGSQALWPLAVVWSARRRRPGGS